MFLTSVAQCSEGIFFAGAEVEVPKCETKVSGHEHSPAFMALSCKERSKNLNDFLFAIFWRALEFPITKYISHGFALLVKVAQAGFDSLPSPCE